MRPHRVGTIDLPKMTGDGRPFVLVRSLTTHWQGYDDDAVGTSLLCAAYKSPREDLCTRNLGTLPVA